MGTQLSPSEVAGVILDIIVVCLLEHNRKLHVLVSQFSCLLKFETLKLKLWENPHPSSHHIRGMLWKAVSDKQPPWRLNKMVVNTVDVTTLKCDQCWVPNINISLELGRHFATVTKTGYVQVTWSYTEWKQGFKESSGLLLEIDKNDGIASKVHKYFIPSKKHEQKQKNRERRRWQ